jgi:hypothetical protein
MLRDLLTQKCSLTILDVDSENIKTIYKYTALENIKLKIGYAYAWQAARFPLPTFFIT